MPPLVSVLTTLHNCRRFITEALDSILSQSLRDLEIVVCDDASTDDSAEVVAAIRDPRVRLLRHRRNMGAAAALRTCATHATGRFFAVLESDDIALPGRFEHQIAWLEANPDTDAVFGGACLIGEDSRPLPADHEFHGVFARADMPREAWLRRFFTSGNCLCWSTVAYRPDVYSRIGTERHSFQYLPDFDLWVRLALRGRFRLLPDEVTAYRRLPGAANLSAVTPERTAAIAMEQFAILRHFDCPDAIAAVTGTDGRSPAARLAMARAALAVPSRAHRAFAMELLIGTDLSGAPEDEAADFLAEARPLLRDADVFQKLKVARLSAERDRYKAKAAARR